MELFMELLMFQKYVILNSNKTNTVKGIASRVFQKYVILNSNKTKPFDIFV